MKAGRSDGPRAHEAGGRDRDAMPALRLYIGANLRLKSELESWRLNLFKIVMRAAQEL